MRKYEPGPRSYNPIKIYKGPKYTLCGKRKSHVGNGVPGPGKYKIEDLFKKPKKKRNGLGLGKRYSYLNKTGNTDYLGSYYSKLETD